MFITRISMEFSAEKTSQYTIPTNQKTSPKLCVVIENLRWSKHSDENDFKTSPVKKKPHHNQQIEIKTRAKSRSTTGKPKQMTDKAKQGLDGCDSDGSEDLPTFKMQKATQKPLTKRQKALLKKNKVRKSTLEQLLIETKELEEYKKEVAKAKLLVAEDDLEEVKWPTLFFDDESKRPKGATLDCKHLTLEDVKQYFEKNTCFLKNIMSGKQYSKRHTQFSKRHLHKSEVSLTISYSMIVFSFEQIHEMAKLMNESFDPDNEKDEYFFKVLIPELCLKIFMDAHKMNKKEAIEYLENRPVD